MQQQLPGVINKLRDNTDSPSGLQELCPMYTEPLLSQTQLDSEYETIDALEQQVN
jgi:hypothetical protein